MTTYALVELTINDSDGMGPYMEKVADTVAAHGGKYLIRGGETEVLEGTIGQHPLKVVLEFPDKQAAKAWYDSPEYQAILPARLNHTAGNFLLVEGI
ncbi:MAG: DUF1330 domain-containing protein [Gammaproteobacteria bacterium]